MARKSGLGRGLGALIPGDDTTSAFGGIHYLNVNAILPNPRQPRSQIPPEELHELTTSIQEHGILQPLVVSYDEPTGKYILIAGERRLLASQQAGLETVPAIIREVSEQQRLEIALVENLQRTDLSALEAAQAYRQLAEDFNLSHEEISLRVGKNRATITNTLRLLKLPMKLKQALVENKITEGHARALLSLPTEQAQVAALQTVLSKNLSVRQTEEVVRKLSGEKPTLIHKTPPAPELLLLEERLRSRLGTKVQLTDRSRGGGTITIHYYSEEELNSLIKILLGDID
jgi:ParB family chromosome partitioning protein